MNIFLASRFSTASPRRAAAGAGRAARRRGRAVRVAAAQVPRARVPGGGRLSLCNFGF